MTQIHAANLVISSSRESAAYEDDVTCRAVLEHCRDKAAHYIRRHQEELQASDSEPRRKLQSVLNGVRSVLGGTGADVQCEVSPSMSLDVMLFSLITSLLFGHDCHIEKLVLLASNCVM
jgi:hypothetical protein